MICNCRQLKYAKRITDYRSDARDFAHTHRHTHTYEIHTVNVIIRSVFGHVMMMMMKMRQKEMKEEEEEKKILLKNFNSKPFNNLILWVSATSINDMI